MKKNLRFKISHSIKIKPKTEENTRQILILEKLKT